MNAERKILLVVLLILVFLVSGILIFGFVLRGKVISHQYQIRILQTQINSLKKGLAQISADNVAKPEAEAEKTPVENGAAAEKSFVFQACGTEFNNAYTKEENLSDQNFESYLSSQNEKFKSYFDKGYRLKVACKDEISNKILYFMDNEQAYIDYAKSENSNEKDLSDLAKKAVVGESELNDLKNIYFYDVTLSAYRFEGTGSIACHFDNYYEAEAGILYICIDANDNSIIRDWYLYSELDKENYYIKHTYKGSATNINDKEEVFDEEYFNYFTKKQF